MKKIYIILFMLSIFLTNSVTAQKSSAANPENDFGWVAFGFGLAKEYDISSSINFNYGRKFIYNCAFHRTENISYFGNNPDNVNSISIGFGYSEVSRFTRVAFSVGPSYVFGNKFSKASNKRINFKTIGLLLNTQTTFTPIKEVGLGLDIFANINKEKNIAGVVLTIFLEGNK